MGTTSITGWNTEHDASRTPLAAVAHVVADNIQRELDCNLRSNEENLSLFEVAFVLLRFDHVARFIVNANHCFV
jgi:hypothetical protein